MGKEEMACRTDLWHLALLKRAIEEVDERYIRSGDLAHHDKPEVVETEITLAERVFAYELYRQWANLLEPYKTGLVLNGETRKDFIRDFQIKFKSKRNNSNNNSNFAHFYPDIVLHDENVEESKCNMIVCEIKRYENIGGTIDDLNKLSLFLSKDLKPKMDEVHWDSYHYAVLLLVGPKKDNNEASIELFEKLKNKIEAKRSELDIDSTKQQRIICMTYNGTKESLKYASLKEIMNEVNPQK